MNVDKKVPSEMPSEKKPSSEKPEKKPDYQSTVARHLAQSKGCATAYSDSSFRVDRVCPLSANLEIMEALYILRLFIADRQVNKARLPVDHIHTTSGQ